MTPIQRERVVGAAAIVAVVLAGLLYLPKLKPGSDAGGRPDTSAQLIGFATRPTIRESAVDQSRRLKDRDPIFLEADGGEVSQAGYVERVEVREGVSYVTFRWYHQAAKPSECRLVAYENTGRLEDAFAIMFPPAKQQRIQQLVSDAMQQHGQRLSQRFVPIVEQSLRDSLPVIEAGFRASVERHRDEVEALGARWNEQVLKQRLLPLAKSEIVPIVRRHGEPLANTIGQELWERASIWSFTWRAIYDKSPLPQKDLMKREWERFVEEEAIPVVESHASDIAGAIQKSIVEIAGNSKVRSELAAAAESIAKDQKTRALVQTILQEAVVDNKALRRVWQDAWTSPEAQAAISEASRALEPTIRKVGDELMGSRDTGIDPAFARLLRNQVLQKDQRWVIAKVNGDRTASTIVITKATESSAYPLPTFAAP